MHDAIGYEGPDEASRSSPASTTTPGASKAASQTARTSWCADISSPSPRCAARSARVSFETREPVKAAYERSDVCVVPAAGVAAEAMVALAVARLVLEKFGGDSLARARTQLQRLSANRYEHTDDGEADKDGDKP